MRELGNGLTKLGYDFEAKTVNEYGVILPLYSMKRDAEKFPNVEDEIEDIEEFFYQVFEMEVGVYKDVENDFIEVVYWG